MYPVSDNENQLKTDLSSSIKRLDERTRERDEIQLKLVKSDARLLAAEQALEVNNRLLKKTDTNLSISTAILESKELELAEQKAKLAMSALEIVQKKRQLMASDLSLAKRTDELERTNQELKAMITQRENFVAAITHDLKSPLLSATRIMEYLVEGQIPQERQPEVFKQLLESNREMLRMLFNLLDIYRFDAGKVTPLSELVDVPQLVAQCVEQFRFNIDEKKIDIAITVESEVGTIESDGVLLKRIFTNLLSNAVKFSSYEGKIVVRIWCDDDFLYTSVQDNGTGMSEEQKLGIFKRFWQTGKSRETGVGTGLGLFLSKELACTMGGDLTFVSEQEIGTEFTLSLPLSSRQRKKGG